MNQKILITGATGLVGGRLTELLLKKGVEVLHVGRGKKIGNASSFIWDVKNQQVDPAALKDVSAIIHLAGAGVADKRWTANRKKEILDSRVKSTSLLFEMLKTGNHQVKTVVAASAIGYYGFGLGDEIFTEDSQPGSDFLAQVTAQWEMEVDKISALGIRVVKLRIGIVLSEKGGALVEMAKPIRWGVGAPLGTGEQILCWIHIDDLCSMFIKALDDDKMIGVYNAVGTGWVTNKEMTKAIALVLNKPLLIPSVPGFVLKIILGEMAEIVLQGSKVSCSKIEQAEFSLHYTSLNEGLIDLLRKKE